MAENNDAPVVAVLDYGIGNLRSAEKALAHLGAPVVLTADPGIVRDAIGVVLPGVGHFGACMAALRAPASTSSRATPRPPGDRSSASASACRCCSKGATRRRASPGSACCRGG